MNIRQWPDLVDKSKPSGGDRGKRVRESESRKMLCCLDECYRKVVKLRDMENSENDRSLKNVMLTEWNNIYPEDQLSEDALFTRVCKYHKEKRSFNKMDADVSHEHCVSIDQNATSLNSTIIGTSPETTCMFNPGNGEQNEMPHCQNKSCLPEHANMPHDQ